MDDQPIYPTWIKPSRIRLFWTLSAAIVIVAVIVAVFWLPGLSIAVLALPFLYIALVITLTSWRLSPQGDDLQARIHDLIISGVGPDGRLLDIGCGSGELIIKFAKDKDGDYTGLDYWPGEWAQFGKIQAQRNAALEGVPNVQFVHGSASELPFADGSFERVVSSLTFHEVKDVTDKTTGVSEALRVLAPGGPVCICGPV